MKESDIRDTVVLDEYLAMVEKDIRDLFDPVSFEDVRCPACSSSGHAREFEKSGFRYVSCKECSTLFVNPRPTFEALNRFYSSSPSASFWVNRFFKPMALPRREKIFRPRAERIAELIGADKPFAVGDIGAGFGLFLEEMRSIMPRNSYLAIEPSYEMAGICREKGLKVRRECLEEIRDMDGHFDLLTAFEIMEHLHDPADFVRKVHSLLKPKGRFFLTTLNGMGFDILMLWARSKSVMPPHHLNFFNTSSVKKLLERAGFIVEEVSTPGKLDWDIVEKAILSGAADPGRFWDFLARQGSQAVKSRLQEWIAGNNLSSHMMIVARKGA
ncbi:MAG: class I SAM-dependent methyltransferase [Candidatus Omnitrophota bacterium]